MLTIFYQIYLYQEYVSCFDNFFYQLLENTLSQNRKNFIFEPLYVYKNFYLISQSHVRKIHTANTPIQY